MSAGAGVTEDGPGLVDTDGTDQAKRPPTSERPASVAEQLRTVEPLVRGICRRKLGAADGDDAAQRALVQVWRKLESAEDVHSLPGFATTVARHEVFKTVDELRRRPMPSSDWTEWVCADDAPRPDQRVERDAEVAAAIEWVEGLLAQLTPRAAEVMRTTVLADRSTADAAAILGIQPTSVRSVQVRAMARMREICGTQSRNPLASNVPYSERARVRYAAERARAAEGAEAQGGRALDDERRSDRPSRAGDDSSTISASDAHPAGALTVAAALATGDDLTEAARASQLARWHTDDAGLRDGIDVDGSGAERTDELGYGWDVAELAGGWR